MPTGSPSQRLGSKLGGRLDALRSATADSCAVDDASITVTLELRIDGEWLSGRAVGGDGEAVGFDGWLGLLAALDALVQTTSAASSGREP